METIVETLKKSETLINESQVSQTPPTFTFDLEHNVLAPMSVHLNTQHHILDLNVGKAISLTMMRDTGNKSTVCQHGNFICLVSPEETVQLKWSPEINSMRISLSAQFVNRIIERDNVKFKTQCNFEDPLLHSLVEKLRGEKWIANSIGSLYSESLAIALVVHLASNYAQTGKKIFAPKGKLSSGQLNNLYEFTRSAINRNIKLAELASVVHMSEFHFARLFKQTTGISPYRFVLQLKIDQAKMLIRKEKKSCSDIAYLLNFSDQAHFSHVFKKVAGCSPRSFMNAVA